MMGTVISTMEKGLVPDTLVRAGIRRLCKQRLESFLKLSEEEATAEAERYVQSLKAAPLAEFTRAANEQHYELPPAFFSRVLGKHLKYSSCFWPEGCASLDDAEEASLAAAVERADLSDGQKILELGCGWGSLSLYMAARFPAAQILSLSNSAPQRQWIESQARERGLNNLRVVTRNIVDVVDLEKEFHLFDRVVSVEMFEHLKNYEILLHRISRWLAPGGKLFVHIFTHRDFSYPFETEGEDNWMGKYFFTGGQMPGRHLLSRFQKHLLLEKEWTWSGVHYAKTADAWLENMDRRREEILPVVESVYGAAARDRWFERWRIFFMACSELFGYERGRQWGVSHYLFENRRPT